MLFDISKAGIEVLQDDLFVQKEVTVSVLRLDKIHPIVSGNKFFKLHYFLQDALKTPHKAILTFGGAYSNHLSATAFACKTAGLKSIGIVRGEKPAQLSATLQQCMDDGMQLKFISRNLYADKENKNFIAALKNEFGECLVVPEGGYSRTGAEGAAMIAGLIKDDSYTHICTATGTATTLAGLLLAAKQGQIIAGLPVLKYTTDNKKRIAELTGNKDVFKNLLLLDGYHFGGYAKKTSQLIEFMNQCWIKYKLPLDFVYTAKMLYGVVDCIKKDTFKKGSNILCLHTGGLQGNKSLPLNTLLF